MQQAWEELGFEWKRAGLTFSSKENNKKRMVPKALDVGSAKRGRKKKVFTPRLNEDMPEPVKEQDRENTIQGTKTP